jgi:hypothetical protein
MSPFIVFALFWFPLLQVRIAECNSEFMAIGRQRKKFHVFEELVQYFSLLTSELRSSL